MIFYYYLSQNLYFIIQQHIRFKTLGKLQRQTSRMVQQHDNNPHEHNPEPQRRDLYSLQRTDRRATPMNENLTVLNL